MSSFRLICLSILMLALAACGDKDSAPSAPTTTPDSAPETVEQPAITQADTTKGVSVLSETQVPNSVLEAIRSNHPDLAAVPHKVNVVPNPTSSGTQLYEIVSSMGILYTDASARWLMAGVMYFGQGLSPDGQEGVVPYTRRPAIQMMLASLGKEPSSEDINPEEVQKLLSGDMTGRQMFDALPLNMGFSHQIGNGTHKVAVFEDPDCPYCQKFHQDLAAAAASGGLADLDVELITFPYVLSDRHPNAQSRARFIACSSDPSSSWTKWMLATAQAPVVDGRKDMDGLWEIWAPHNVPSTGNCARAALVDAWQQAGIQMGFVATPTFLFADGTTHEGLLSPSDLREMINLAASNRARQPISSGGPLGSGTSASTQAAAALRDLADLTVDQQPEGHEEDQAEPSP